MTKWYFVVVFKPRKSGPLSPRRQSTVLCGLRRGPQNVEGCCECIEWVVRNRRQGVALQFGRCAAD